MSKNSVCPKIDRLFSSGSVDPGLFVAKTGQIDIYMNGAGLGRSRAYTISSR